MDNRRFHLLTEPWVQVIDLAYQVRTVSLVTALLQAHTFRGLAGETETQNVAVLRFLLAVLHTVFSRAEEQGRPSVPDTPAEAIRLWSALWEGGSLPEKPIRDYLERWSDRFWLFDAQYPFYQVSGIQGTENPAKKLNGEIVESKNKMQLFCLRSGRQKDRLTYAEAARWLIYLHAFGDTAAKKPSPKMSWVGGLGTVLIKGNSLFETLLLNLTLLQDGMEPWGAAKPAWERQTPNREKLTQVPLPGNQPELLTLQCRRVQLQCEGEWVVGYVEAAGDYVERENAFSEQMTFWRTRKRGNEVVGYYPGTHDPARQMWRDFSVLMGRQSRKPGVVAWVSRLKKEGKLPKDRLIIFQTAGVLYGSMCCGMIDEFSDELQLHATLLEDLGQKWQRYLVEEVEYCNRLADAVKQLSCALDLSIGGSGTLVGEQAKTQCYYRLDVPFRHWLSGVDPEQPLEQQLAYREEWRATAKRIARNLGREMVEKSGPAALIGRKVEIKIQNRTVKRHACAPRAFSIFLQQIS